MIILIRCEDIKMKHLFCLIGVILTTGLLPAADVTYVPADKVSPAVMKGGALAKGNDFSVSGVHRAKAGQVEVHDKETDIFYITDGAATFVTGGTVVGGKSTRPGQTLGTDIQGGETHHLGKGDVITIPAGTPHWFKEVSPSISYYMVKVIKE
jgi:mannose-6-phosphate isomerase-like protein (cupin superfamily)